MFRFEIHTHSEYSNLVLLDSINKLDSLIMRALHMGLAGITITDHEALCGHVKANQLAKQIQKEHPDFKVALGNEIYLCPTRESGQRYYHFILIAKNRRGYRALRELSSRAWMNSYYDRRMERRVTLYSDLEEIVKKYPDSLIATTACLGGELSVHTWNLHIAEKTHNDEGAAIYHENIVNFVLWCKELFGDDFYIECAPGQSKQQVIVNNRLGSIAQCFDVKMVVGTDAHYLTKNDRYVHKSYLNSKGGEREVDDFYEYAYLQDEDEIKMNLAPSGLNYETLAENSMEIYNKIENFTLAHPQVIPWVNINEIPIVHIDSNDEFAKRFPVLTSLYGSNDNFDRYWVNECIDKLKELNEFDYDSVYMARLEEEADIKKTIGEKLGTNMFRYPITLQHYIDMFWECGSTVGAGRGSSCSGLNHYLLGVTQLDPIKWELPFWRLRL